jgi:hypothetical protein
MTKRERRQEFMDDFLARYRKSLMALKVVRWECERIMGEGVNAVHFSQNADAE